MGIFLRQIFGCLAYVIAVCVMLNGDVLGAWMTGAAACVSYDNIKIRRAGGADVCYEGLEMFGLAGIHVLMATTTVLTRVALHTAWNVAMASVSGEVVDSAELWQLVMWLLAACACAFASKLVVSAQFAE